MIRRILIVLLLPLLVPALGACQSGAVPEAVDAAAPAAAGLDTARMLEDARYLSADALMGRRTGTPGNAQARTYLVAAFERMGVPAVAGVRTQAFAVRGVADGAGIEGVNVLGLVEGTRHRGRYIVITAHYDHLGVGRPDARGDSIYNGADDNASGTAALLALASYFRDHPPEHSILFAALDAEELGLQGAHAFVANPPVPLSSILLNVNMDMVSRSEKGELFAVGTRSNPFLKPVIDRVSAGAPIRLLAGHDLPIPTPSDDWTGASDHAAFHAAGIPYLYFGVEDHVDYHERSDEFSGMDPVFYGHAVRVVLAVLRDLDGSMPPEVLARTGG